MFKMKTKVKALQTSAIKLMKVFGVYNDKGKLGTKVMASVKEGQFANNISKKGTKHKCIVATSKARSKSILLSGAFDIKYNVNTVLLYDSAKNSLILPFNSLIKSGYLFHGSIAKTLAEGSRKAKRKEVFSLPELSKMNKRKSKTRKIKKRNIDLKINDMVKILAGNDKGKVGKVLRVNRYDGTVQVEGVSLKQRYVPFNKNNQKSRKEIKRLEGFTDISNVQKITTTTTQENE